MSEIICCQSEPAECLIHGNRMPLTLKSFADAMRDVTQARGRLQHARTLAAAMEAQLSVEMAQVTADASVDGLAKLTVERDDALASKSSAAFWLDERIRGAMIYREQQLAFQSISHFSNLDVVVSQDVERLLSHTDVSIQPTKGNLLILHVPAAYSPAVPQAFSILCDPQDGDDRRELIRLRERIMHSHMGKYRYTISDLTAEVYECGLSLDDELSGIRILSGTKPVGMVRLDAHGISGYFLRSGQGTHAIGSVPQFRTLLHGIANAGI